VYRAQRRGGKGIKGAKVEDEDPIQHLFVASTHDYLLFFTTRGKVYWLKVYELPELDRDRKGRALVNLLELAEGETVADCRAIRDFDLPEHYLVMATKKGLVKKTELKAYSRPKKGGIIAIKLREDDELIDIAVCKTGDELLLATQKGLAIRFSQADARPMGRNTSGVKGIGLTKGDALVGMVVVDPEATLLTVCENGYGKRTLFGPNSPPPEQELGEEGEEAEGVEGTPTSESAAEATVPDDAEGDEGDDENGNSANRYRLQRRGGKGVRDIKTTERNGKVIGIVSVTTRGKIQRMAAGEINTIGRNTQGVRIMRLDENDTLAAVVRVPKEDEQEEDVANASVPAPRPTLEPSFRAPDFAGIPDEEEFSEDGFADDLD
jgi:DNA gyrase subunit A